MYVTNYTACLYGRKQINEIIPQVPESRWHLSVTMTVLSIAKGLMVKKEKKRFCPAWICKHESVCSHGVLPLGVLVDFQHWALEREVIYFFLWSVAWLFSVVYSEQHHTVQIEGGLWLWSNRKETEYHNKCATHWTL